VSGDSLTAPVELYGLVDEIATWQQRNFGPATELVATLGTVEELGEICRAAVKRAQGIRGTREQWEAEIYKETGDVFVKLVDISRAYGFNLADAILDRWGTVSQRDWVADPIGHGIGGDA